MKRRQAGLKRDHREQGGKVAVPDERLTRVAELARVKQRQHLSAAISAADADDAANRRIRERCADSRRPDLRRTRNVTRRGPREHRLVVNRLEPEPPDLVDALVELPSRERAGRSYDGETVAGRERARLSHHRYCAISSAINLCSSRPIVCRSACHFAGRDVMAAPRNRSFTRCWRCSASSTLA